MKPFAEFMLFIYDKLSPTIKECAAVAEEIVSLGCDWFKFEFILFEFLLIVFYFEFDCDCCDR